ncbi:hypothetical protein M9H77_09878 [Catharanthus roseus]|uniref:Uncharacterized protein n=1 Tax=Catharanthus roseus TaxID=4058 RepID=A0ACC0C2F0_CATRO|nr:hypothetical protein M9H77_09878 [Catharanthus roseus]
MDHDRSGRTHDRMVTTSSRRLKGRHSIFDIHTTLAPIDLAGSSFVDELLSGFPDVSLYISQHMDHYGNSGHVPSYTLGLREHGGDEGGEETRGPTPGGPQDPEIKPLYGGHIAVAIWRREVRFLRFFNIYLGQALHADARDLRGYYIHCLRYLELLGTTYGGSVLEYRMRLDTMSAFRVRWTPYTAQEIEDIRFATYHCTLAFFDTFVQLHGIPTPRIIALYQHLYETAFDASLCYYGSLHGVVFLSSGPIHDRLPPGSVYPSHPPIPAVVILDALDSYISNDDPANPNTSHARFLESSRIVRMY